MARDWVDEGLRHTREPEEQQRLASQLRHHQASVIKEKGPDLMRGLVAEVRAVIDEYRRKAHGRNDEVEFEALPHEGFCVAKSKLPRVSLECRPDYEAHVLYCNVTRTDEPDRDTVESVFGLNFTVDESDHVELRQRSEVFQGVDEAVEFLLKPVLFPLVDRHL